MKGKLLEFIKEAQKDSFYEIEIDNWIKEEDLKDISSYEELEDLIRDNDYDICNREFIYYSDAIQYLAENDQSLADSLDIASSLGFSTEKLSSTLLATLHKTENCVTELNEDVLPKLKELLEDFKF